ncbi:hypothetical protein EK904_004671 [Melospiza melodia maxima]|nr:hypothetical protein EK904_004671 [Melospiza melodia maxima]
MSDKAVAASYKAEHACRKSIPLEEQKGHLERDVTASFWLKRHSKWQDSSPSNTAMSETMVSVNNSLLAFCSSSASCPSSMWPYLCQGDLNGSLHKVKIPYSEAAAIFSSVPYIRSGKTFMTCCVPRAESARNSAPLATNARIIVGVSPEYKASTPRNETRAVSHLLKWLSASTPLLLPDSKGTEETAYDKRAVAVLSLTLKGKECPAQFIPSKEEEIAWDFPQQTGTSPALWDTGQGWQRQRQRSLQQHSVDHCKKETAEGIWALTFSAVEALHQQSASCTCTLNTIEKNWQCNSTVTMGGDVLDIIRTLLKIIMTMVPQSREMIPGHLHICSLPPSMITKDSEEVLTKQSTSPLYMLGNVCIFTFAVSKGWPVTTQAVPPRQAVEVNNG